MARAGGKCRYCRSPIKSRYPVVEALTGLGYAVIAVLFPLTTYGAGTLGLMALFTLLLVASAIDLDTYTIPDELTLPGVALGLAFAFLNTRSGAAEAGLPTFQGAVQGALLGAGLLVTIDLIGSWVLRRFRERQYPEAPIGYQQISLALLVGAWLGPWWGLGRRSSRRRSTSRRGGLSGCRRSSRWAVSSSAWRWGQRLRAGPDPDGAGGTRGGGRGLARGGHVLVAEARARGRG